ncbi:MAG: membrane protein insertase YidC, partial [Treponemataceae bacterium]|nr:membrane protein insertase YidC [Treponemataceae bacterium]
YKDNPQKQQEMMAKLYKDSGYNPMSGCLPLIVQFLILFAMYNLFNNYFEFRGASFIPKWIPDLSSGDSVHTFSRSIPFFGNQLRILPVVYLVSQLLYGKITGNGGTAAASSTKTQMNMMMYGMPIVFFFLFYNAPSGLLLYWTVSNLFQMVQQIIINKMMKEKRLEISSPKGRAGKNK